MKIMAIFTRTPLHVGAGNSVGAVDSPIMRERHTRIPIIPGSNLKGVLADLWNSEIQKDQKGNLIRKKGSEAELLFGQIKSDEFETSDSSGNLLIGEARVLLFPVRSAKGSFSWITSPLALARLKRDTGANIQIPDISDMNCYSGEKVTIQNNNEKKVILEEYVLKCLENIDDTLNSTLQSYLPDEMKELAKGRITIVSDEIFSYFCENACEVVTRIRVNDETGTVDKGALFNQEQVPSETLLYAVIGEKKEGCVNKLENKLKDCKNIIQIGGDETIGLGFCSVSLK